ncbi:MAG: hypothetical protein Q8O06_03955 [Acetobacterium sp.]|nr:hypothetical protein [Bacillota bacterium]MDP2842782.1 hypothetical protein [Acetobacterium sp.]
MINKKEKSSVDNDLGVRPLLHHVVCVAVNTAATSPIPQQRVCPSVTTD